MSTNNRPPYLICELANSHAGSESVVRELIGQFGALEYPRKGVKFQILAAETIALPDFPWYKVYQQLEFSPDTWRALIAEAARFGDVWLDIFDRYGTAVLRDNLNAVRGLKLQSSVLENEEVLGALRGIDLGGKQLIMNVSGFALDHIHSILADLREICDSVILQVGFQSYPTRLEDTGLVKIPVLQAAFPGVEIALSDHADGNSDFAELVPIYGRLLGCEYLEKHFCLDRANAPYDGFSALEPAQMQRLCGRLMGLAAAGGGPFIGAAERKYLAGSVQVPVLKEGAAAGEPLRLAEMIFRRTSQEGLTWREIDACQRERKRLAHDKPRAETVRSDEFRPAHIAAIVACRMKSSRLRRKALKPIQGVPSVERCLQQCFGMPSVSQVILATSDLEDDAVLADHLCDGRASFWAGDPDDVISRYLGACDQYGVDVVVRITADCPVVSPEIVEHLLREHFASGADYTAAAVASVGTAGEIIEASALREIMRRVDRAEQSEYMTWYFRNNPDIFRVNIVDLPPELVRPHRLTLDHAEDLEMFEELFRHLGSGADAHPLSRVFEIMDSHPEIASLNSHIETKYVVDKELIALLDRVTRLPVTPKQ